MSKENMDQIWSLLFADDNKVRERERERDFYSLLPNWVQIHNI